MIAGTAEIVGTIEKYEDPVGDGNDTGRSGRRNRRTQLRNTKTP